MAQFVAAGQGAIAAGKVAAKVATDVAITGEKMAAQGFDIGAEMLKSGPGDFKKNMSGMLDKAAGSGDGLIANTIRTAAAYERFHYQLTERLHPTDNLINATTKQTLNMFKELTDQVKNYFCGFFKQLYAENGEQLRFLIIKTIQKMSQQPIMIKDYIEPSIKMIILEILSDKHTKNEIMTLLRGDCLQPEKQKNEPLEIITGGAGGAAILKNLTSSAKTSAKGMVNDAKTAAKDKLNETKEKVLSTTASDVSEKASSLANKASSFAKSLPSSTPSSGTTGPVPMIEISYLDTPDRLKSFICDSFQRMFTDRGLSVKGLILSNLETLVENSEDIKKRNYDIIIKIIDEMFDNPKTKEEFIRHLSGGCSVPRIPQLYVHSDKKLTPEEQHKKELQEGSDPLLIMKKMSERKFPVALGGTSKKKHKRNNSNLHHKTRKQTKK